LVVRTALLAVVCAALAGHLACATPSPQPAIDDAKRAVEIAEQAEARRFAAQELAEARDELRSAQEMAQSSSDWIEARRLAERAQVNAELAVERARVEQLRISLTELRRSIEAAGADDAGSGNR
jgi:sugar phosphate isomerase/epimerase